ncbi:TPA: hypothetical protein EYO12_02660 [Candidatus Saccharibacteria bacterium]|nr:hypothetical protein [Candidatus Saccharibacteria bacterium]HIO88059.1 hypothetical protein [Candidatus Saccharibacteria bacterium]
MKKFLTAFVFLLAFGGFNQSVHAAELSSLDITTAITIAEDDTQTVVQTVEAASTGDGVVRFPLPTKEANNLSVEIDGTAVEYDLEATQVQRGPFTVDIVEVLFTPPSASWQAELSYDTTSLLGDGELKTIAVAALDYSTQNVTEQVEITAPLTLGVPVAIGTQADDSSVGGGMQTYVFRFDEARTTSVLLDFATTQSYRLNWSEELKNTSFWWQTKQVVLAPDTNQQVVHIEDISPKPTTIHLDTDGNIIAMYNLGPKRSVKVEASAVATVRSVRYAIDDDRGVDEVPGTLEAYVSQTGLWASGQEQTQDTAKATIETLYEAATEAASQTNSDSYLDVLNSFIADVRASGLPARLIAGTLTHNGAQALENPTQHYWAEVYLPGTGWMTADPAMNTMYEQFGVSDGFHVAEFIRGIDSEKPPKNHNTVQLLALNETPDLPDDFIPLVAQTKYLLLPGLSFTKTTITMLAGAVVDGVGYEDGGNAYRLGSLAPLQEMTRWRLALGSASWGPSTVGVGLLQNDAVDVVAEADSNLSFIPAIVLAVVVAASVYGFIVWRRKRKEPVRVHEADEDIQVDAEDLLKKP